MTRHQKRRWFVSLIGVTSLLIGTIGATNANAHTSKATYEFHAGDGGGIASPDVAVAPNGETVSVSVNGSFDAGGKTATGVGTFVHKAPNGTVLVSGTISVSDLTVFQFYGCGVAGGEPLPPELCGGRSLLRVSLHPEGHPDVSIAGTLEIICLVGPNVPKGAEEGIKLNVPGLVHFNKSVSGETLFVAT